METSGEALPAAIHAPDLSNLVNGPGPFATVYLTTEAAVENAAQRNQVRWKSHRDALLAAGAPQEVVATVDEVVPEAHHEGEGLGVIVRADGAVHVEHGAAPPQVDRVSWAPLPRLVQLLAWRQSTVAHLIVLADRQGADVGAVAADGRALLREVAGDDTPISKVGAGGWSQRRYQERAENTWEKNAGAVADTVIRLASRIAPRFIAVAGDVRALTLLRQNLPADLAALVQEIGGGPSPDGSDDAVAARVAELIDQAAQSDTAAVLDVFREELGQRDRAADGAEATLAALAAAQVDVLLVHDDGDDERTGWFGPDPTAVAITATTLRDLGVAEPTEGRLVDLAVRAALGTGAGVRAVPDIDVPTDGLGAILRWSTP
jgi:hypothetical protein